MPAWLTRTQANDIHRAAALRQCPRCHAPILTGLDADRAALTARADPQPINAIGETLTLLAGRRTYDLITTGHRKELHYRDETHISAPRKYPVLPEHQCGGSMETHAETIRHIHRYVSPDEPPY